MTDREKAAGRDPKAVETDGAMRLNAQQKQYFEYFKPLIQLSEYFAEPNSEGAGIRKYPAAQFSVLFYSTDEGGLAFSVIRSQKCLLTGEINNDWSGRIYAWSSGDWEVELIHTLLELLIEEMEANRDALLALQRAIPERRSPVTTKTRRTTPPKRRRA